ncbi:hypothetical protein H0H92_013915 [Tricholoma furcatifolium]|nr:hypothetical protein H0H92_013915 [Tricholoma furcatifolium]
MASLGSCMSSSSEYDVLTGAVKSESTFGSRMVQSMARDINILLRWAQKGHRTMQRLSNEVKRCKGMDILSLPHALQGACKILRPWVVPPHIHNLTTAIRLCEAQTLSPQTSNGISTGGFSIHDDQVHVVLVAH